MLDSETRTLPGLSVDALDRSRIAPTLLVVGIIAAVAAVLLPPMYAIGRRQDDRRVFLRNYRPPNEFEAFTSFCVDYAKDSDEANDVLFVGDSSLRYGLRTRQFERETGLRAYNLGSVGLIAVRGYTQMVRTYLSSHHPRPRLIVLGLLPGALVIVDDAYISQEHRDVKARLLWCYGLPDAVPRPHDTFLYHARQGFKYVYGLLVGGFDHFVDHPIPGRAPETYRTFREAAIREKGYSIGASHPIAPIPARAGPSPGDPFTVSSQFEEELSELIRLTDEHGVPLLIRLTPYSGRAPETSPTLRAWAEDLESRHPHVTVARPEVLLYDTNRFFDPNHLTPDGAAAFTHLVATEVKEFFEKGRGRPNSPREGRPASH